MIVRGKADAWVAVVVASAIAVRVESERPLVDDVLYVGVLIGAAVVACVAAWRAPAPHRVTAWLVAAGIALTALGDTIWEALDATGADTDVSMADPAWFASYVALCAALVLVLRRSAASKDWAFVLDAATIVVVSLLVLGSSVVGHIVTDPDHDLLVRAVWSVYPVADAVLLALVVRILTSRVTRTSLDPAFAGGLCLWLTADLLWLYEVGGAVATFTMDAAWMVAPVLMARSLWRLGTRTSSRPAPVRSDDRLKQLVIAVVPLLVPPALEVVADLRGDGTHHPALLAVGAVALTSIAFVRMALLIRSEDRARADAEEARDAALEASAAKSRFLGTVGHEVRTPLTVVVAASELLEDSPLDAHQAALVGRLRRSGLTLTRLVDEILDFTRLETGRLTLTEVDFDLASVVEAAAAPARERAEAAGLAFDSVVDLGPRACAVGDPQRLGQVVDILLGNAVRFTEAGLVRLDVRRPADDPDAVEVRVTDTGIGIPADQLETIFDSFHQVDSSCTRLPGGVGLGLAICRELTGLMGGSLTVSSDEGVGSVFVARVHAPPLGDPAAPVPPILQGRPGAAATGVPTYASEP